MFGFLFGRKKENALAAGGGESVPPPSAPPARTAPGTRIGYSPELVDELKADHRQLLQVFVDTRAAHAAGDLPEVAALLAEFRSLLSGHLLKEKVRFYVYLEHALAGDPDRHAVVIGFRHEMEGIGKTVLAFLDRYRDIAAQPALADTFGTDLGAVGKVLVERIRSEEDRLYALYRPVG